ncbi:uncharacterized protein BDFB_008975, partial [Asbolus verrucosus]
NAGTNVAPGLVECYNTTLLVTRDYRLPATITTLIEIIRKIEDASPSANARELSIQILHRFRQDGIRKTYKVVDSTLGLPYSPKGWEAYKNRVQLKYLTPGNAINFNNDSITPLEACSLHYMISSSIETHERGDESTVCNKIAHYTSRLHKRETEFAEQVDATTRSRSSCPIESGVIYTKWGAVKAGLVLAGIASGFEPNPIRTTNGTLETAYASTIAGELSEVALNQPSVTKTVGNDGGWNSTLVPKYYFLEKSENDNLYLTDAEIRGGLDGLYLGLSIPNLKSSDMKISQILDLYYGRGLFNDTARACNRKELMQNLVQDEKLVLQTTLFNTYLDTESQYSYTPNKATFPVLARNSVESFRSYINNGLNDLRCMAENEVIERVAADVLIFVDVAWDYSIIETFLSYIIQSIDINNYESSYTVFDGVNGDIIVNKSRSILDFYKKFNHAPGFDYTKVLQLAENLMKKKLDNETDLTGQATIVLILPHNTPTSAQNDVVVNKRNDVFKRYLPDLRIIVAGSGSKSSYNNLVTSASNDVFTISESVDENSIKETARVVVERLKKLPRNVVNPKCGSSFTGEADNFEVTQYVEPFGVNYHKISSNYFYKGQTLKIRGQGYGSLTVCTSRTDANPRANSTGANCKNVVSDEISTDISGYCSGDSVAECSPIYISVEGGTSQVRCSEKTCRFPDNIKYSIYLENVNCSSSSEPIFSSFLLISLLFAIMRF